jgi:hypothetical protein
MTAQIDNYLSGAVTALPMANMLLAQEGKQPLFCPPHDFTLDPAQLREVM